MRKTSFEETGKEDKNVNGYFGGFKRIYKGPTIPPIPKIEPIRSYDTPSNIVRSMYNVLTENETFYNEEVAICLALHKEADDLNQAYWYGITKRKIKTESLRNTFYDELRKVDEKIKEEEEEEKRQKEEEEESDYDVEDDDEEEEEEKEEKEEEEEEKEEEKKEEPVLVQPVRKKIVKVEPGTKTFTPMFEYEPESDEEPEEERIKTDRDRQNDADNSLIDSLSSYEGRDLTQYELIKKKIIEDMRDNKKKRTDAYNEARDSLRKVQAYANIINQVYPLYKEEKQKSYDEDNQEYKEKKKFKGQARDTLDFFVKKNDITRFTPESTHKRQMYQQLRVLLSGEKKLSQTDTIKNEDAYRNEYLFQKIIMKKPIQGIDITGDKFYARYDTEDKDNIYELKSVIKHKNQKDTRFYIGKEKIDELLKKQKQTKKIPKIIWSKQGKTGELAYMNEYDIKNFPESKYKGRLYTLKNPLTEKTFSDADLNKEESANINQEETYVIKLGDPRIKKGYP